MKFPKGPVVRVHVRKELITKAVTADSTKCWIAEAIREAVPQAQNVAVDLATVRFSDMKKGFRYVYLTPYTAQKGLIDFDEGRPPDAFSFRLRNAHVTRAGTRPDIKEKRAKTKPATVKAKPSASQRRRIIAGGGASGATRVVGGRRPPQLRHLRQFGIRSFRGASKARLEADVAMRQRAESAAP